MMTRAPRNRFPLVSVFFIGPLFTICTASFGQAADIPERKQSIRKLQQNETDVDRYTYLRMTLRFSVWFPDFTVEDDGDYSYDIDTWSSDPNNTIRQATLNASLQALCDEGDMMVVKFGDDFDPAAAQDICSSRRNAQESSSSRRLDEPFRHLEDSTYFGVPSLLADDPEVVVRLRSRDRFTWSIWTLRYTVLQIGDIYIQEALQNEPGLQFSELAHSSTNAMEQVAQLALDLSIMEGTFDSTLVSGLDPSMDGEHVRVHSSPIRREVETFGSIYNELYAGSVYEPEALSVMRLSGVALLLATVAAYFALPALAKRRRRMLVRKAVSAEKQLEMEKQDTGVLLGSPQGVEDMLQKSSFAATDAAASPRVLQQRTSYPAVLTGEKPKEADPETWESYLPRFVQGIFSGNTWKAGNNPIDTAIAANLDQCVRSIMPNSGHTRLEELVSDDTMLHQNNDIDSEEGDRGTGMLLLPQNLQTQK